MSHDGLDKEHLFLEIHAGDKAVLVTADVEDERPGSGGVIGSREGLRYFRKMLPSVGPRDGEEAVALRPTTANFSPFKLRGEFIEPRLVTVKV